MCIYIYINIDRKRGPPCWFTTPGPPPQGTQGPKIQGTPRLESWCPKIACKTSWVQQTYQSCILYNINLYIYIVYIHIWGCMQCMHILHTVYYIYISVELCTCDKITIRMLFWSQVIHGNSTTPRSNRLRSGVESPWKMVRGSSVFGYHLFPVKGISFPLMALILICIIR
jgi:hypothetical protein